MMNAKTTGPYNISVEMQKSFDIVMLRDQMIQIYKEDNWWMERGRHCTYKYTVYKEKLTLKLVKIIEA